MAITIRANDVKASNLLALAYGLVLLTLFIQIPPSYKSPGALMVATILALALMIGISVGVRRDYRWMKIFFLLLTMWDIIRFIVDFPHADDLALATLSILATIAKAWAFVIVAKDLLRKPEATDPAHG